MRPGRRCAGVLLAAAVLSGPVAAAGDPDAAERQYRIARRLAAERSAEAAAALEKVVSLDPAGDLADDALVDHALLLGVAAWPEDLGLAASDTLKQAASLLSRVLEQHAAADRAIEARYLLALSRLEPLPAYDAAAARLELLEISLSQPGSAWDRRARYTRAWLEARQGNRERALATYQRLLVDAPASPEAARARLGQARILLRNGEYGRAARWLQESIDAGVADCCAPALRELAVRALLRGAGRLPAVRSFESVVPATDMRSPVGMAAYPDGGLLLAGARREGVRRIGPDGPATDRWELDQVQAVTIDDRGQAFAVAGDSVYRLAPGGLPVRVAGLGDFGPASSLAVDPEGAFWILDRRGERLARVPRGTDSPVQVWGDKGRRLDSIVWDGAQIVGLDARNQTTVAIDSGGKTRPLMALVGERATWLAADPTGRLAVLDQRAGTLNLISPDGSKVESVPLRDAGIERPAAVAIGMDGRLHVLDAVSGAWLRTP